MSWITWNSRPVACVGLLFLTVALVQGQERKTTPESVPLMEVTKEGRAWMATQIDVAKKSLKGDDGGLIDGSTFLQEGSKEKLDALVGKSATALGHTVVFRKLKEPEYGYHYAFSVTYKGGMEETWYLSESPLYKDQFPRGRPVERNYIALWMKGADLQLEKLVQESCVASDIFDFAQQELRPATILARCRAAKVGRENEGKDPAKIHAFDLPKDRPIAYIGLIDANPRNDPIIASLVDDMKYWPELLVACGYKIAAAPAARYIPVADDPAVILEQHVREQKKKGIRDLYLNLTGHGNLGGIHFLYTDKEKEIHHEVLTSEKLFALFDAHQDCRFTVSTVGCHGGGFAPAVQEYKDPAGIDGRITIFLQVKSHSVNQEGRLKGVEGVKGAPKAHSTYYCVFLAQELLQKKGGYGAAHLRADEAAKRIIPCDAEVWRSGKNGGIFTGKLHRGVLHMTFARL